MGLGYLMTMVYLIWSLYYGEKATMNPWKAYGLEWTVPSPPPTENFVETPVVTQEAYDYASIDGTDGVPEHEAA
jgi:cytochrome c oxidase subunit 1